MFPNYPKSRSFAEYLKRSIARKKLYALTVEEEGEQKLDENDEEDDVKEKGSPQKRKTYEREHYEDSCWWRFLQRDNLDDLTSRDGKTFRNRFTVPYQLFLQLLTMATEWFPQNEVDVFGKQLTPISLKLLGTLRILGKGCS